VLGGLAGGLRRKEIDDKIDERVELTVLQQEWFGRLTCHHALAANDLTHIT
jgi:hypothetical protein